MVAGEVHLHLPLHADRAILAGHHGGPGGGHRQDRAGAGGQDRIEAVDPEHAEVGEGEGAGAVFVGLELLGAGPLHQVGPRAGEAVEVGAIGGGEHRRNQAAIFHGHGDRHIDGCGIGHAGLGGCSIHLGMAGQGHGGGLGEQGSHRDALGLHLLVEGIELVGGDRVAHPERWHLQAGHHVAVHRLLEGVESHGVARAPKGLARRGGRRRGGPTTAGHRGHSRTRSLRHAGQAHRLAGGGQNVFSLDAAMGTAAPQGLQGHTELQGELAGPWARHHTAVAVARWGCHRHHGHLGHWSGRDRGGRCWGGGSGHLSRGGSGCRRVGSSSGSRNRRRGGRHLGLHAGDLGLGLHDQPDRFTHRRGATGGHQHGGQKTLVERLHIHVGLVGLDHQHRLTALDLVAGFLEPLHDLALRHGGAEGGHENFVGGQRWGPAGLGRSLRGSLPRLPCLTGPYGPRKTREVGACCSFAAPPGAGPSRLRREPLLQPPQHPQSGPAARRRLGRRPPGP